MIHPLAGRGAKQFIAGVFHFVGGLDRPFNGR